MKSQRERDAEQRRQKLEQLQEQIRSGSLTVRQMTPEEREKYAARPRPERPGRPARRRRR
jgi:hypothetical protein